MQTVQITKTLRWSQVAAFPVTISVDGFSYRVDLGPGVQPRYHTVRKDRTCTCPLGKDCPVVLVVADHLRNGGQRAPDPPDDYWFIPPVRCPVCGGPAAPDPALDNRRHGRGWRCLGDASHYWQLLANRPVAAQQAAPVALAATAALRLGDEAQARRLWQESLRHLPHYRPAKENLRDLSRPAGERHAPWPFEADAWIDAGACAALLEALRAFATGRDGPEAMRAEAARIVREAGGV